MRKVVNTDMVAHLWANQSQPEARNGGRSVSFAGDTFYSYSTPIARIVTDAHGRRVALFSSARYSMTTKSNHFPAARRAWCGYHRWNAPAVPAHGAHFDVPSLGVYGGRHREIGDGRDVSHGANLAYLVRLYDAEKLRFRRALRSDYTSMGDLAAIAIAYARAFALDVPAIDADADYAEIAAFREARHARLNSPAAIAKRERAKAKRDARIDAAKQLARDIDAAYVEEYTRRYPERIAALPAWNNGAPNFYDVAEMVRADAREYRERIARMESPARVAQWYAGANVRLSHVDTPADDSARLRVKAGDGATLQTSHGAEVPLSHARKLFALVAQCRAESRAFTPNGRTIHVGAFTVSEITTAGDLRAGCHYISWREIERFARERGWYDSPDVTASHDSAPVVAS